MMVIMMLIVTVQEYFVLDGSSVQAVAADGQHTSFESTKGSFNRFIFMDECSAIVGWMRGETKLHVSILVMTDFVHLPLTC